MSAPDFIFAVIAVMLALSVVLLITGMHYRKREQISRKLDDFAPAGDTDSDGDGTAPARETRRDFLSVLRGVPMEQEIVLLLRQAGFPGLQAQLVFTFINISLPVVILLVGMPLVGFTADLQMTTGIWLLFVTVIVGFLLPRWMLRMMAARRAAAIAEEVPVMMQLLMMLMETGMSIENAFRVLLAESRDRGNVRLLPEFSKELSLLFSRLDAGGTLAYELEQLSGSLQIEELSDMTTVLRHALQRGGNVRDSLTALLELMDERRQTRLQEMAGRISGKMSIVMMAFIFPALLVFTAGPGLIALLEALREISS